MRFQKSGKNIDHMQDVLAFTGTNTDAASKSSAGVDENLIISSMRPYS